MKTFAWGLFLSLFCLLLLGGAFLFYLLCIPSGSSLVTHKLFSALSQDEQGFRYKTQGSFASGVSVKNIEIHDLVWFAKPNTLKIQSLFVDINGLSLDDLVAEVENARLFLPQAEAIVANGKFTKGMVDGNVYALSFDSATLEQIVREKIFKGARISLAGVDLFIDGSINQPHVKGGLTIESLKQDGLAFTEAPVAADLVLSDLDKEIKVSGKVTVSHGLLQGPKTALVTLKESHLYFQGDPLKPKINLTGTSSVENINIKIILKGTLEEPDLKITSEPVRTQAELLVMLATNKGWKGAEATFQNKKISADLAKDLIDYFLLAGTGSKIAQRYGITDFSVKYDEQTKGVSVTKKISEKLDASYGIEQSRGQAQAPVTTRQKIGGEVKVTDSLSVSAQKELLGRPAQPQGEEATTPSKEKADDQILLKYKKSF